MSNELTHVRDLANKINEHHASAIAAARSAIEHAIAAGGLLAQVKAELPHGQWGAWLAENFAGSERTASNYMRLYRNHDRLESKSETVSDLTVRQALDVLATPKATLSPMAALAAIERAISDGSLYAITETALAGHVVDPLNTFMQRAREIIKDSEARPDTLRRVMDVAAAIGQAAGEGRLRAERRLGELLTECKANEGADAAEATHGAATHEGEPTDGQR